MAFTEYQHIERIGTDEVADILVGTCYVFPKIDGTNASVWNDETGTLHAGSRKRELSLGDDNAGFCAWVYEHEAAFYPLFGVHPTWRVFGEWLVPHTLRTYRKDAWRKFYVFDVLDDATGMYLPYPTYQPDIDAVGLPCIPPIRILENGTEEHLVGMLDGNTYLIDDGNGSGEGLVVKNYEFVNQFGHQVWAKVVRNEFKERNLAAFGVPTVHLSTLEDRLAEEYVTDGRVAKVLEKMRESAPIVAKRIPELLNRVWYDVITEEVWGILKEHKNPTIDFKRFYAQCVLLTKQHCPELFGTKEA